MSVDLERNDLIDYLEVVPDIETVHDWRLKLVYKSDQTGNDQTVYGDIDGYTDRRGYNKVYLYMQPSGRTNRYKLDLRLAGGTSWVESISYQHGNKRIGKIKRIEVIDNGQD